MELARPPRKHTPRGAVGGEAQVRNTLDVFFEKAASHRVLNMAKHHVLGAGACLLHGWHSSHGQVGGAET